MSRFTFILNPLAGKGAGRRLKRKVIETLRSNLWDFELVETSGPLDATNVARSTSSPVVVAVGGDGTVHEVLNGIIGTEKTLGIIPIGSGNDFVKSIAVPARLKDAIELISRQQVRRIDVGRTRVWQHGNAGSTSSHFINGVGVGFDAAVAERTRHISYLTGTLLYLVAVLQTLQRYDSPIFSVDIDGWRNASRNLLIAIGNGICAGGGFYLTPKARVDDGVLDICLIDDVEPLGILKLMPSVMRRQHERLPEVQFKTGSRITIDLSHPSCVHADGEMLGNKITRVEIDVVPKALNVVTG